MNTKIATLINELKNLTLHEAAFLIKEIEKTFDVDASIQSSQTILSVPTSQVQTAAPVSEEKISFDIILSEVPSDKKIPILKVIRTITGLGLKESKDIVDNIPKLVKEGVSKDESESIKKDLESAGAKVIIK